MERQPLFVFAGQSNMQGASALPFTDAPKVEKSYEYVYKSRRFGRNKGGFRPVTNLVGEWAYCDKNAAYPDGDVTRASVLAAYTETTYFLPALCDTPDGINERNFAEFSESNFTPAASLVPFFCSSFEALGHSSLVAHIAKGAVSIFHYFDEEMLEEYGRKIDALNAEFGTRYAKREGSDLSIGAARYFAEKVGAFFEEADRDFPGADHSDRGFLWLQGESDWELSETEYRLALEVLWNRLRALGFTAFFCLRVGYWSTPLIAGVIRAQESFCREVDGCYMVTRAPSLIPLPTLDDKTWFIEPPDPALRLCRDSFKIPSINDHFNAAGHKLFGERCAMNVARILFEDKAPILEKENLLIMR